MSGQKPDGILSKTDPYFSRIKNRLISVTGLEYYAHREEELHRRIAERVAERRLSNCEAYFSLLQSGREGEDELNRLIAQTTVGETHFFRHRELFDALRETVLPDVIDRQRTQRRLRIWSAGCSIGAEPYSISILLRRDLAAHVRDWDIEILGTDINSEFLVAAGVASFDEWAMRDIPEDIRQECFDFRGERWHLKAPFKDGVKFQRHNLVLDPFPLPDGEPKGFDVILCRNVMIYFGPETNDRMLRQSYAHLAQGGWLIIGHAEHGCDSLRQFEAVRTHGAVVYRRSSGNGQMPPAELRSKALNIREPSAPSPTPPSGAQAEHPNWSPCDINSLLTSVKLEAGIARSKFETPAVDRSVIEDELERIEELADQGNLEAAAEACERLLSKRHLDPSSHFLYALILAQLNRDGEAIDLLRRAIYLDRAYAAAHHYLGLLLQKQGEHEQATRCFQNACRLISAPTDWTSSVESIRGSRRIRDLRTSQVKT